jgi:hypothetical protein
MLWVGKGEVVGVGDAVGYAESVGVGDAVGSRPPRIYFSTKTSRIEVGFGVESTLRPTPFPGASLGKYVNVGHGDDGGCGGCSRVLCFPDDIINDLISRRGAGWRLLTAC